MLVGTSRRYQIEQAAGGTQAASEADYARAQQLVPAPLPAARKAAILAQPRIISSAEFIDRIPAEVWARVQAVATPTSNPALAKALYRLAAGADVNSASPQLLGMLAALVQAKVITAAERAQILDF